MYLSIEVFFSLVLFFLITLMLLRYLAFAYLINYAELDWSGVLQAYRDDGAGMVVLMVMKKLVEKHRLHYYHQIKLLGDLRDAGLITDDEKAFHADKMMLLIISCVVEGGGYYIPEPYDVAQINSGEETHKALRIEWNKTYLATCYNKLVFMRILPFVFPELKFKPT